MEDRLKPCPHCGAKLEKIKGWYAHPTTDCFNATVAFRADSEESIEAWNTRKPMDRIVEQLEKWKQEADEQYEDTDSELYKMASVGKYHAYKQAIEIVKEGGKDE